MATTTNTSALTAVAAKVGLCLRRMPLHSYAASKSCFPIVLFAEQGRTRELRAIAAAVAAEAVVDTS